MRSMMFSWPVLVFISVASFIPGVFSLLCGSSGFQCPRSQTCLPKAALCNGWMDCSYNSDEQYCDSRSIQRNGGCPSDWWLCADGNKCIPRNWICNKYKDCSDGSDEPVFCGVFSPLCGSSSFNCVGSKTCKNKTALCDGLKNCIFNSEEQYCNSYSIQRKGGCPSDWWLCANGSKCIPKDWICDEYEDCSDGSDEPVLCDSTYDKFIEKLHQWLTLKWIGIGTTNWRPDLFRIAIALLPMEPFMGKRKTMLHVYRYRSEMKYVSTQLINNFKHRILSALTTNLTSNELALTIHALIETCSDPSDFYGFNLVSELRTFVERSKPRPYDLLALCNAHPAGMTPTDVQRAIDAFNSKHRAFETDNQAMALLALSCMRSKTNLTINETEMASMEQKLKDRQFQNGTFGNIRTTALVLQALLSTNSNQSDYRRDEAINAIIISQRSDGSVGSLADSFYAAPLLRNSTKLNINNSYCSQSDSNLEKTSGFHNRKNHSRAIITFSVKMGDKELMKKTLYVPGNTLYNVIEIIKKLDKSLERVDYNVLDDKPYVFSVNGVENDIERGIYWYTFVSSSGNLQLSNQSPVDIIIKPELEYMLWYKKRE